MRGDVPESGFGHVPFARLHQSLVRPRTMQGGTMEYSDGRPQRSQRGTGAPRGGRPAGDGGRSHRGGSHGGRSRGGGSRPRQQRPLGSGPQGRNRRTGYQLRSRSIDFGNAGRRRIGGFDARMVLALVLAILAVVLLIFAVSLICSCKNELTEFVSYHIFCNIYWNMLSTIIYCNCMTYK